MGKSRYDPPIMIRRTFPNSANPSLTRPARLIVGAVIGSGVFLVPSQVSQQVHGSTGLATVVLNAAAVEDDRLQRTSSGHVNPDSFAHASSEQRIEWFQKGYSSGDMNACNTFAD